MVMAKEKSSLWHSKRPAVSKDHAYTAGLMIAPINLMVSFFNLEEEG